LKIAENLGYRMVLWTDDPGDYSNPGNQVIVSRLLKRLSQGGILVLHDGPLQTLGILPKILSSLEKKGYTLVTLEDYCR
jgi:peptidoglycan/xylan/chitin deacetylase (PgdA/CDA1 family)